MEMEVEVEGEEKVVEVVDHDPFTSSERFVNDIVPFFAQYALSMTFFSPDSKVFLSLPPPTTVCEFSPF